MNLQALYVAAYMVVMVAVVLAIGASAHHDDNRYYEVSDNTSDALCGTSGIAIQAKCSSASTWTDVGESVLRLTCGANDNLDYRDQGWPLDHRVLWSCDADPPGIYGPEDVNKYMAEVTITGSFDGEFCVPQIAAQSECMWDIHHFANE